MVVSELGVVDRNLHNQRNILATRCARAWESKKDVPDARSCNMTLIMQVYARACCARDLRYPQKLGKLTLGEWHRMARMNHSRTWNLRLHLHKIVDLDSYACLSSTSPNY